MAKAAGSANLSVAWEAAVAVVVVKEETAKGEKVVSWVVEAVVADDNRRRDRMMCILVHRTCTPSTRQSSQGVAVEVNPLPQQAWVRRAVVVAARVAEISRVASNR